MLAALCILIAGLKCCEGKTQTTEDKIDYLTAYKTAPVKAYTGTIENKKGLSEAFDSAAREYEIDVDYLIVIAWFETVFRNLKGDSGRSWGEMQVGRMGRRKCQCSMETVASRIQCGACWLDMGRKWGGTLNKGLQAYICGTCEPRIANAKRAYNRRMRVIKKLKEWKWKN